MQSALSMPLAATTLGPMKDLGRLVRRERERRGLRGTDLGAAIGRDAAYVSRLENGVLKEIPDPTTLAALAARLGVEEVRLLEAIGYHVRPTAAAPLPFDSDRADLIALLEHELTEPEARVLAITARAMLEERDARTVLDAERYAAGTLPTDINQPGPQPVPSS